MKKVKRKIIRIDEDLCDGCGICIPSCAEQAIQLVDTPAGKKARLVKEFYCDGLGACLGSCPTGALTVEEREAEPYDEAATLARIRRTAPELLEEQVKHPEEHAQEFSEQHAQKLPGGVSSCPSVQMLRWAGKGEDVAQESVKSHSALRHWPIQLHLVHPSAPYYRDADLVIAADCVPFAYAKFHEDFLKGKVLAIGCPKLDDIDAYRVKLKQLIETAHPRSITIVHMEVPCCSGFVNLVRQALRESRMNVPLEEIVIRITGEKM
ncbi:MAG TPA: 4Fe-4S dicluster domain-containing protein [Methanomicrobia archaeon]|nr:4Fe-4S dicluster domain-containing protein [Methanomicrobia archaeon]